MININLQVVNPWSDKFEPLRFWHGKVSKNKAWELQTYRSNTVAELEFRFSLAREDHVGLTLGLGLFSWTVQFRFYDVRHWDYENNCWIEYEESNP
jgi:hypothetical protein